MDRIRPVNLAELRDRLGQQNFDNLMREKLTRDQAFEQRTLELTSAFYPLKRAYDAKVKAGTNTIADNLAYQAVETRFLADDAQMKIDYQTWALSVGLFETITDAKELAELVDRLNDGLVKINALRTKLGLSLLALREAV